jgi:hypothetical protein
MMALGVIIWMRWRVWPGIFFVDLFTADPTVSPDHVLNFIEPMVSQEINEELCRDTSDKEVSDALFQMGPL